MLCWDAVTTQCDGAPATDLAGYEVLASYERSALIPMGGLLAPDVLCVEILNMEPLPGQVLYMRVRAWDLAGNNSDECDTA